MKKHNLKEAIIEYVTKQDMVDMEIDPGWYYFTTEIKIGEDGSVHIHDPSFTLLVTKKGKDDGRQFN